jgi:hypothetical protein
MDARQGGYMKPEIFFMVGGPEALGRIEVFGVGENRKLEPAEGGRMDQVGQVLFNSGRDPQLFLQFSKPTTFITRREGVHRAVQIVLEGELRIEIAPENLREKQELAHDLTALQKAQNRKDWPKVEAMIGKIVQNFGDRLPQASKETHQAKTELEAAFKEAKEELDRNLELVAKFPDTASASEEKIKALRPPWAGSSYEKYFKDALEQIARITAAAQGQREEKEAERLFLLADRNYKTGTNLQISISYCKKIMREYEKSQACAKAKELLVKAEQEYQRAERIALITDRLKKKAEPFLKASDYQSAVKIVSDDEEFRKNSFDLKEIQELIRTWQAKAAHP